MYDNFEYQELNIKCKKQMKELKEFLLLFDLRLDDVDYSLVVRHDNKIIATISKYANLVKCSAICSKYTGNNILNSLMTKVFLKITEQGFKTAFLITKIENKSKFQELGLYEIYKNDKIVYFTNNLNRYNSYIEYLSNISKENKNIKSSAIVMNANPFTIGHLKLIETASKENKIVYIIPVLEDISLFTYNERKLMIQKATSNLDNVIVIEGSEYLISKSTFPSYFLSNDEEVVREQCKLDVGLFLKIYCDSLNIKKRYVGTEPFSRTTEIYNEVMKKNLTNKNIEIVKIERYKIDGIIVSASLIRKSILEGDTEMIKKLTPSIEHDFLLSEEIKERVLRNKDKIIKNN